MIRSRVASLSLLVALAACACGGGDDDASDARAACQAATLSAPATDHTLPSAYPAASFLTPAGVATCGAAGTPTYALLDLIGDAALDLVVTRACGDDAVGDTRWRVHAGGAGFDETPLDYALPSGYATASFQVLAAAPTCGAADTPTYSVYDITGDGAPDLVVTRVCGDATVGDTRWLVHQGGSAGFAQTATTWPLPSGYVAGAFQQPTAVVTCGLNDTPSYFLGDAGGDGAPDLVVTRVCGDDAVGDSGWRVHTNSTAGFADSETTYALPGGYVAGAFRSSSAEVTCGLAGTPSYVTADTDGDSVFDLVVTRVCGDAAVGDRHWRIHRGAGSGFGDAGDYALPAGYVTNAFIAFAGQRTCGLDDTPSYTPADLDGDGLFDLVVTRVCGDVTVGTNRWRLHGGGASGFAAIAVDLALPSGYVQDNFTAISETRTCGAAGTASHALIDADGDERPDLVISRLCGDSTVGDTRWLLHRNECAE